MRARSKGLIGLLILIGLTALAGFIFLVAIPRLPTGYAELEKQRQADLKADGAGAAPSPAAASRSALSSPATPNPTATGSATRPSNLMSAAPPPTRAETPRQAFERCWRVIVKAGETRQSIEPELQSVGQLSPLWNQMQQLFYLASEDEFPNLFTVRLSAEEWEKASPPTSGTLARAEVLRPLIEAKIGRPHPVATFVHGSGSAVKGARYSPDDLRKRQRQSSAVGQSLIQTAPLREATELLRLPEGVIPALPTEHRQYGERQQSFMQISILIHAFLYGLTNDPGFDVPRALRRLNEIRHYHFLAEYLDNPDFYARQSIQLLTRIVSASGLGEGQRLRVLARALAQLSEDDRAWALAMRERIHRYQAAVVREQLLALCEPIFAGTVNPHDNAFHYFFDGKPERLWVKANAMNVRRHIDLLAVAMAKGDPGEVQAALDTLKLSLKLANIRLSSIPIGSYGLLNGGGALDTSTKALKVALLAWWKDKGKLPEDIGQLIPDYLPATMRPRCEAAWIEWAEGKPALTMVSVRESPMREQDLAQIRDPVKFREMAKTMLRQNGQMATDAQIEASRLTLLNKKQEGAMLNVSGMMLDFAVLKIPQGSTQGK